MSKPELVLYIGDGCPYCHRVTEFMEENNIVIPIKDTWNDENNRKELLELAGAPQVPCLKIEGKPMHESLDIIEKLKEIFL